MSEDNHKETEGESGVATLSRPKAKEPSMYKVFLMNDDYTTMDFVVHVLQQFFSKSLTEATKIMMAVHKSGKGLCGLYPYGVAETKVAEVNGYAKKNEMPLKCTLEKE